MNKLNEIWAASNARLEGLLKQLCADRGEPQLRLFEAMAYSLNAGGKRLRPFLVYQFCKASGGTERDADNAALALEMIHTYSLIHDDLPAMDNDDYRRGKLTNHKVYGEAMAILAGDGLLTDAFLTLASAPLPPERVAQAVRCLAENAGSRGMVGGQALDMLSEERELTEEEVLAIQTRKTGCLIKAACVLGVLCGGGSPEQLAAAERYADGVGLAFQIRDDLLDLTGDAAKLGKAVGVDGKKNTFVRLWGPERCQRLIAENTDSACAALSAFPEPGPLAQLARALAQRDH
ncbi:MAG: polyprenyl synthetase family protein [Oscillospiraceae bacterium]|nr:polyprenyl synthetase family protein [Oscillospiraceae bacterium]